MKPTRNRVMCPDCWRLKMLFKTRKKAINFIKWNRDELEYGGETLRAYYCRACCGWHISHQPVRWYGRWVPTDTESSLRHEQRAKNKQYNKQKRRNNDEE